jgi:N-acetyl-anhydromuramyl-L-alanine amidase AmpD
MTVTLVRPPSDPPARPPLVAAASLGKIAYVEARWYRRGPRRSPAIWVVLHATHGAEGKRKAEDCAHMFATLPATDSKRSAHCVVDTDSVVQCVPWESEAWHAGAHANQYGEGIELCGRADQKRHEWLDAASLPMLSLAAHLVRWRCQVLGIPIAFRTATDLRARAPGVTTHAELSRAFPNETTHTDPGPHFPMRDLMEAALVPLPSERV